MAVHIEEKAEPKPLHRGELRNLVAYKVVGIPTEPRLLIDKLDMGDVVVPIAGGYRSDLFNATKERLVTAHQVNSDWREYKFKRARYVRSIQLTFDVDED